MYYEEFPGNADENAALMQTMAEKIESGSLSKNDIILLEPIFTYGHMDVHLHLKAKKRFIWF